MRNAPPTTADFEKLPMQCCKKPAFNVPGISKLMSFVRPDVKRLLSKVGGIDLASGETEAESVKIAVIKFYQIFKFRVRGHGAVIPK
jgi:hypothetical protein